MPQLPNAQLWIQKYFVFIFFPVTFILWTSCMLVCYMLILQCQALIINKFYLNFILVKHD